MELGEGIGMCRVKRSCGRIELQVVWAKGAKDGQIDLAHTFDDAFRELVCSIRIEMGVVLEVGLLPRKAASRIMYKGVDTLFLPKSFVERAGHAVQVYERYVLA